MKVIVSCSGKFHAFNLVEQLEKSGNEVIFFTAYSSISNTWLKNFIRRQDMEMISKSNFRTNIFVALLLKLFRKNPQIANDYFDNWVSRKIKKEKADYFVGWSGMSLTSIKVAKLNAIKTILERGSAHIEVQNDLLNLEYQKFKIQHSINKKTIKKELNEYSNADFISLPSRFCKNSFLQKNIHIDKIIVNPYGVSNFFNPILESNSSKLTFIFLGKLSIQKGIHLLFKAISELIQLNYNFEFVFIGEDTPEIIKLKRDEMMSDDRLKFFGHINHYDLNEHIGRCDIAVIPSIQDGFAMVVPQILKVGLPVIVSKNTGAEQLITNGKNGWVVNPEVEEIKQKLIFCIENINVVKEMRHRIINEERLDDLSWENYGNRYLLFLKSKLEIPN